MAKFKPGFLNHFNRQYEVKSPTELKNLNKKLLKITPGVILKVYYDDETVRGFELLKWESSTHKFVEWLAKSGVCHSFERITDNLTYDIINNEKNQSDY